MRLAPPSEVDVCERHRAWAVEHDVAALALYSGESLVLAAEEVRTVTALPARDLSLVGVIFPGRGG